jgi:hypothetical protein
MLGMADPPTRNQLPGPIPNLESLPSRPRPAILSPGALARQQAEARSNSVCAVQERAAYMQLLAALARAQGISTNAIGGNNPATTLLRAAILRRAAKTMGGESAP